MNNNMVELLVTGQVGLNLQAIKSGRGAFVDSFYRSTDTDGLEILLPAEKTLGLDILGAVIASVAGEDVTSVEALKVCTIISTAQRPVKLQFYLPAKKWENDIDVLTLPWLLQFLIEIRTQSHENALILRNKLSCYIDCNRLCKNINLLKKGKNYQLNNFLQEIKANFLQSELQECGGLNFNNDNISTLLCITAILRAYLNKHLLPQFIESVAIKRMNGYLHNFVPSPNMDFVDLLENDAWLTCFFLYLSKNNNRHLLLLCYVQLTRCDLSKNILDIIVLCSSVFEICKEPDLQIFKDRLSEMIEFLHPSKASWCEESSDYSFQEAATEILSEIKFYLAWRFIGSFFPLFEISKECSAMQKSVNNKVEKKSYIGKLLRDSNNCISVHRKEKKSRSFSEGKPSKAAWTVAMFDTFTDQVSSCSKNEIVVEDINEEDFSHMKVHVKDLIKNHGTSIELNNAVDQKLISESLSPYFVPTKVMILDKKGDRSQNAQSPPSKKVYSMVIPKRDQTLVYACSLVLYRPILLKKGNGDGIRCRDQEAVTNTLEGLRIISSENELKESEHYDIIDDLETLARETMVLPQAEEVCLQEVDTKKSSAGESSVQKSSSTIISEVTTGSKSSWVSVEKTISKTLNESNDIEHSVEYQASFDNSQSALLTSEAFFSLPVEEEMQIKPPSDKLPATSDQMISSIDKSTLTVTTAVTEESKSISVSLVDSFSYPQESSNLFEVAQHHDDNRKVCNNDYQALPSILEATKEFLSNMDEKLMQDKPVCEMLSLESSTFEISSPPVPPSFLQESNCDPENNGDSGDDRKDTDSNLLPSEIINRINYHNDEVLVPAPMNQNATKLSLGAFAEFVIATKNTSASVASAIALHVPIYRRKGLQFYDKLSRFQFVELPNEAHQDEGSEDGGDSDVKDRITDELLADGKGKSAITSGLDLSPLTITSGLTISNAEEKLTESYHYHSSLSSLHWIDPNKFPQNPLVVKHSEQQLIEHRSLTNENEVLGIVYVPYGIFLMTENPWVVQLKKVVTGVAENYEKLYMARYKNPSSNEGMDLPISIADEISKSMLLHVESGSEKEPPGITTYAGVLNFDSKLLFESLSPINLVTVLVAFLLEYRIVVVSSQALSAATHLGEWLKMAIFPLNYSHLFAPLVSPDIGCKLLSCPTPYYIGCRRSQSLNEVIKMEDERDSDRSKFSKNDKGSSCGLLVVDIDYDDCLMPEDLQLPVHCARSLIRALETLLRPSLAFCDNPQDSCGQVDSTALAEQVMGLCRNFVSSILEGSNYCSLYHDDGDEQITLFDEALFVSQQRIRASLCTKDKKSVGTVHQFNNVSLSSKDIDPLLQRLLRTQCFSSFLSIQKQTSFFVK